MSLEIGCCPEMRSKIGWRPCFIANVSVNSGRTVGNKSFYLFILLCTFILLKGTLGIETCMA